MAKASKKIFDAAGEGKIKVVAELLKSGTPIDAQDEDGWTPLMHATLNGELDTMKFLLEAGAKVDAVDSYGCTALFLAAKRDTVDAAELLLKAGANVNHVADGLETALSTAVGEAQFTDVIPLLKTLLAAGADPKHTFDGGITLLMRAASTRAAAPVRFLVEEVGADVNGRDANGYTVLMRALISSTPEIAQLLIELGADTTQKNKSGKSALDLAEEDDKKDFIKVFKGAKSIASRPKGKKKRQTPDLKDVADEFDDLAQMSEELGIDGSALTKNARHLRGLKKGKKAA